MSPTEISSKKTVFVRALDDDFLKETQMADIRTSIGGLDLENPVLISSGPLTDTDEILRKVEDFGAGGVILKTGLVEKSGQGVDKMLLKNYLIED